MGDAASRWVDANRALVRHLTRKVMQIELIMQDDQWSMDHISQRHIPNFSSGSYDNGTNHHQPWALPHSHPQAPHGCHVAAIDHYAAVAGQGVTSHFHARLPRAQAVLVHHTPLGTSEHVTGTCWAMNGGWSKRGHLEENLGQQVLSNYLNNGWWMYKLLYSNLSSIAGWWAACRNGRMAQTQQPISQGVN